MKNLMTGLMVAALAAAGVSAEARAKADDSMRKSQTGASSTGSQYGQTSQSQNQAGSSVNGQDARTLIKDWPQVSQQAAQNMLDRYGQPDVVSNMMLVWKDKTPFTKITVTRDAVRHLFPMEHQDVLTEEISLAVPIDKVAELAKFDGSVLVDRTKGTIAARSDKESSNFLALNLADDIITGKRDSDSARKFYADTLAKQMSGKSSAYTGKLNFSVTGDTSYPDSPSSIQQSGESSGGSQGSDVDSPGSGGMSPSEGGSSSPSGSSPNGSSGGSSSPSDSGGMQRGD